MVVELEKKLFDKNRILYSFMPVVGPIYAALTGIKANWDHRKEKKELREACRTEYLGSIQDEKELFPNGYNYGAIGGDGHSSQGPTEFEVTMRKDSNQDKKLVGDVFKSRYGISQKKFVKLYGYSIFNRVRNDLRGEVFWDPNFDRSQY